MIIPLPKLNINTDLSQLIYSLFVIILIPASLAFNSLFLLKSVQRDMDFELNNKALLVQQTIAISSRDKLDDTARLQSDLVELTSKLPEIKAIDILTPRDETFSSLVSTSPSTSLALDPVLNQLAWGGDQVYSKQIIVTLVPNQRERVWQVVSPIHDRNNKKIGLINLFISASQIDAISNRTTRDSLFILGGTVVIVILLLLNHFRFFEISLLYKKLREIDKMKDDFISVASHELRTPLTAISSFAQLAMITPVAATSKELWEDLTMITQGANRLKNLVNDMLDVSRIEQGRIKFTLANYDIRQIIDIVVKELYPQALEKKLKLIYEKVDQPILINCDKDKMQQIITNLVSNAIKYTPTGEVKIYHQIIGNLVKTFVRDTGVGISQQDRAKLFGKFIRIYNEKTKEVSGTGLGLWITRQMVEKMDGTISVDSIENQGSQFVIAFPLAKSQ